jgi:hypothetical protein
MNDTPFAAPAPPPDLARRDRFIDDPRKKSPVLAAVLSAFPGLGQVYVGYYQQGFLHIGAVAFLIALLATEAVDDGIAPSIGMLIAFVWLYNIIDAARRASLYNQALMGLRPMELPEDAKTPTLSGSLPGGLALIVVGGLILAHNVFGLSLDWLADWWPIGLVAAGVWLVAEDRRAKLERRAP